MGETNNIGATNGQQSVKTGVAQTVNKAKPIQRIKPSEEELQAAAQAKIDDEKQQEQSNNDVERESSTIVPEQKHSNSNDNTSVEVKYPEPTVNSPYAVLPLKDCVETLLVMGIPVLGLLCAGFWACGATRYRNQRRLGLAYLLIVATVCVIIAAVYIVMFMAYRGQLLALIDRIGRYMDLIKMMFS